MPDKQAISSGSPDKSSPIPRPYPIGSKKDNVLSEPVSIKAPNFIFFLVKPIRARGRQTFSNFPPMNILHSLYGKIIGFSLE